MKRIPCITRRRFITAASSAIGWNIVPRHVLGGPGFVPPSEKVNLAIVGAGGQARSNLKGLFQLEDVQVISIADAAESTNLEAFYYGGAGGRLPTKDFVEKHYSQKSPNYQVSVHEDFRVMLEKEKSIDAVLCATPDHLHAYVSVLAMRAGKHVYCEKPLTHNIWEARHVAKVAKETGVATQMGSQGHSSLGTRETIEYIQDGAIGAIHEVHIWVNATRYNIHLNDRPTDTPPVPQGLNWDLWLGPREHRPYHSVYHPFTWRDFWAFGCSSLGDFGTHDMNTAVRALKLANPTLVEGYGIGLSNAELGPYGSLIHYHFPATTERGPVKMHWYNGGHLPPRHEALEDFKLPHRGALYIGEKGVIQHEGNGGAPRLFPTARRAEYTKPQPTLKRSNGHHRDWIDACKGGEPASCPFDYGAELTEIVLLGVLSQRIKRPIEWDADAMKVKGYPDAEIFIREPVRPGWDII
ncbi:Gfo/Idh/MocA family oxidoreductase [Phragmitibacter flavus]|uniref:Gfo/Idh/MocA family oxidoreductase n=1 Tax=Phragmitibacter flavus TaxID=2576071 RepID=A0A5R8KCU7_9BACT|nr:Gfo/Idh/MocA family oxidoreductase [Phragmitibacter flavus]TLD70136.1 Gfo/Idh/MocA family oxidoreductase [Phragmitibacter flavus]